MTPREVLLARVAEGSVRGQRKDKLHLALVLEGGGMRGVVSVGMAAAFQARGMTNAFDSIHGSSAGACGGAYFAAGQAAVGASVYYENINNRKFIDFGRVLAGKPIMDKDFLVDHVMQIEKPLAFEKILPEKGFLNVVTTEVDTGRERIFSSFSSKSELFAVLKATVCVPWVGGRPVEIDGVRHFDGGLVQQLAIRSAKDAGATHIVALMTQQLGSSFRKGRERRLRLETWIVKMFYGRELAVRFNEQNRELDSMLDTLDEVNASGQVKIDVVARTADAGPVDRLSIDGEPIRRAYMDAQATATRYLDTP